MSPKRYAPWVLNPPQNKAVARKPASSPPSPVRPAPVLARFTAPLVEELTIAPSDDLPDEWRSEFMSEVASLAEEDAP
jgi:hypothetical protein